MDSLENVEGFNESWIQNGVYAFKLNEQGLCVNIKQITHFNDLESVEDFNPDGKLDVLYGFKLKENGLYVREEIDQSSTGFLLMNQLKTNQLH